MSEFHYRVEAPTMGKAPTTGLCVGGCAQKTGGDPSTRKEHWLNGP